MIIPDEAIKVFNDAENEYFDSLPLIIDEDGDEVYTINWDELLMFRLNKFIDYMVSRGLMEIKGE